MGPLKIMHCSFILVYVSALDCQGKHWQSEWYKMWRHQIEVWLCMAGHRYCTKAQLEIHTFQLAILEPEA